MERLIEGNWRNFYYQTNSLGSIVALTEWDSGDETERAVERYTYDAYGRLLVHTPGADGVFGTNDDDYAATSSVGNPYGFTARRLDPETGLMYYRARYYSTAQGRFVNRDPKGYVDGMDLYAYAKSNPAHHLDPLGEGCFCVYACTVGTAGPFAMYVEIEGCCGNCPPSPMTMTPTPPGIGRATGCAPPPTIGTMSVVSPPGGTIGGVNSGATYPNIEY